MEYAPAVGDAASSVDDPKAIIAECWKRLREKLLDGDRVRGRWKPFLRTVHDAEEFIQERCEIMLAKLSSADPFPGFDPAQGTLVEYLTSASWLRQKAIDWARRRASDRRRMSRVAVTRSSLEEESQARASSRRPPRLFELRWPEPHERVTAKHIMAAVQLWPLLDRDQPAWPRIIAALAERLGGGDWQARLEAAHRDAGARLSVARRTESVAASCGESPRARRKRERLAVDREAEAIRQPITADALATLLGLRRDAAHQQIARYRAELGQLVVGLSPSATEEDGDG